MKRVNNIYYKICDIDNIIKVTNKVLTNVKNKYKVDKFETIKSEHITSIKNKIDSENIKFNNYNIFMITDPKCRIVMCEDIEDKIINHLIADYFLVEIFENKYLDSMVATRINKGSSYGIKLLKKYLNNMNSKYDNFYILKIDIKKYFYNIDHEVLKKILHDNIKDKKALNVLCDIIDSTNKDYINKRINSLKKERIEYIKNNKGLNERIEQRLIEETLNIPSYTKGKGCPIGNQTSQAFGLIYLYKICHYIKEVLKIKYLIVYMDDIILIHENKEYLKKCLSILKEKLSSEYKLSINERKTCVNSIKNGLEFLGYYFIIKNNKIIIKLKNNNKKKFKKRIRELNILYNNKIIDKNEYKRFISSINGVLKYADAGYLKSMIIN